jgi:hypothetical protein
VANDPNFKLHTDPVFPDATDLYNRIKSYALAGKSSIDDVPAPPCRKQGKFGSIGRSPERSFYLHVRRDR